MYQTKQNEELPNKKQKPKNQNSLFKQTLIGGLNIMWSKGKRWVMDLTLEIPVGNWQFDSAIEWKLLKLCKARRTRIGCVGRRINFNWK